MAIHVLRVILLGLFALTVAFDRPVISGTTRIAPPQGAQQAVLTLTSTAFAADQAIPRMYTCDGQDISPPLTWNEPPAGTQSIALILNDPDANGFSHWVVFNLPVATRSLPESVPPQPTIAGGGTQGTNGFGRIGYGGPCPPNGTHRYSFTVYALDTTLNVPPSATQAQVSEALQGHVLAQGELAGTYSRQNRYIRLLMRYASVLAFIGIALIICVGLLLRRRRPVPNQ